MRLQYACSKWACVNETIEVFVYYDRSWVDHTIRPGAIDAIEPFSAASSCSSWTAVLVHRAPARSG
jgi:hypothetical protein